MTATAVLATVLIVVGHLFALSETCRAKCVNILQPVIDACHMHSQEVKRDDMEMDLFAAAESRTRDTY